MQRLAAACEKLQLVAANENGTVRNVDVTAAESIPSVSTSV